MDDSPADADSQLEVMAPYPFRRPDEEERPLPDPMAIRLVPVPDCNPPFDDELPGGRILVSLLYPLVSDDAGDPEPLAAIRDDELAPEAAESEALGARDQDDSEGQDAGDQEGETGDQLGQWPSRFAQVLAETLAGARPASQLTPWTTERARTHIRRLGPLLAVDQRPRVQRVRASQPARDVVEVAVVAEFGSRTRALAARLERARAQPPGPGRPGRDAHWLCTAIESA
jgi:Family of unknown function (DUF6459)